MKGIKMVVILSSVFLLGAICGIIVFHNVFSGRSEDDQRYLARAIEHNRELQDSIGAAAARNTQLLNTVGELEQQLAYRAGIIAQLEGSLDRATVTLGELADLDLESRSIVERGRALSDLIEQRINDITMGE